MAMLLHRHRAAQQQLRELASHHARVARRHERDRRGTVERLPLGHRDQHTRCEALLREVARSEEHTSELQSHSDLVCRLLLEKKKKTTTQTRQSRTCLLRNAWTT